MNLNSKNGLKAKTTLFLKSWRGQFNVENIKTGYKSIAINFVEIVLESLGLVAQV